MYGIRLKRKFVSLKIESHLACNKIFSDRIFSYYLSTTTFDSWLIQYLFVCFLKD